MAAQLVILDGPHAGVTFHLEKGRRQAVGRSSEADFRLFDSQVSRKHYELHCHDGVWTLSDLDSSNGTFVNGERVSSVRIGHGDTIRAGTTSLQFRLSDSGEKAAKATAEEPAAGPEAKPAHCAACGAALAPDAVRRGEAQELSGRTYCSRCVIEDAAQKTGRDESDSSDLFSLLRQWEGGSPPPGSAPPAGPDAPEKPGSDDASAGGKKDSSG